MHRQGFSRWTQIKGQWLCLRFYPHASEMHRPDSWHHQPFCNCSTPMLNLSSGSSASFAIFPSVSTRTLLPGSPFPSLLMTICFMSSLPPCPVSRLSLYSCAISLDAAFFPITSCLIQTFLKAPFHALRLPRVLLPAGLDPHRGPSSSKQGPTHPLSHTPFRESQYTFSYQKPSLVPQPQILLESRQDILNQG